MLCEEAGWTKEKYKQWVVGGGLNGLSSATVVDVVKRGAIVGRNSQCPCGSGRRFKKCCMEAKG